MRTVLHLLPLTSTGELPSSHTFFTQQSLRCSTRLSRSSIPDKTLQNLLFFPCLPDGGLRWWCGEGSILNVDVRWTRVSWGIIPQILSKEERYLRLVKVSLSLFVLVLGSPQTKTMNKQNVRTNTAMWYLILQTFVTSPPFPALNSGNIGLLTPPVIPPWLGIEISIISTGDRRPTNWLRASLYQAPRRQCVTPPAVAGIQQYLYWQG